MNIMTTNKNTTLLLAAATLVACATPAVVPVHVECFGVEHATATDVYARLRHAVEVDHADVQQLEVCLGTAEDSAVRNRAASLLQAMLDPALVLHPPRTDSRADWQLYQAAAAAAAAYQRKTGHPDRARNIEVVAQRYANASAFVSSAAGDDERSSPARPATPWQ